MRTPEQWLAYGDDLPLELAKVLTPGPWKHDIGGYGRAYCHKCEMFGCTGPCSVPDPIKIDWNMAMEYFRKSDRATEYLFRLWQRVFDEGGDVESWGDWLANTAQPKHYLIAAALAVEGSKE